MPPSAFDKAAQSGARWRGRLRRTRVEVDVKDGRRPESALDKDEEARLLERLYGTPKETARRQRGLGWVLIIAGPAVIALGAALDGHLGVIAAGILCGLVGIWTVIDGAVRSHRTRR